MASILHPPTPPHYHPPMQVFAGKAFLVTGSTRGIGRAIAAHLTGQVLHVDGGLWMGDAG